LVSKRWSNEEEDFLKKNYNKMSNKELADKFGVTTISIQRKLSRLNLIRQVQKKWSETEEDFLRENYCDMSDSELAKKFDVTPIAIKRKLNRLGLRRGQRKKVSGEEKKVVQENVVKKVEEKEVKEKKIPQGSLLKYNYSKTYNIGDSLFHEIFKDKGKVIDKQESNEGFELIVVDFENSGIRVLVENIN
jgi:Zn-dependent peptidase ImmA (M78 family)